MDINGNSRNAGEDFDLYQKYDIWLMNIVRNYIIPIIIRNIAFTLKKKFIIKETSKSE